MQHLKEGCCACVAQMTGGGIWKFWGVLCKKSPFSVGFPLLLQPTDPRWLFPLPQGVCTWYITLLLSHGEKDLFVESVSEI